MSVEIIVFAVGMIIGLISGYGIGMIARRSWLAVLREMHSTPTITITTSSTYDDDDDDDAGGDIVIEPPDDDGPGLSSLWHEYLDELDRRAD